MGHAFHRKQMHLNRSRTHGIGIYYREVLPLVRKPVDPAAKEAAAQQLASLDEQRRVQQSKVDTVLNVVSEILHQWKAIADDFDRRLVEFPGWTAADHCALPVDEDVACFYVDTIRRYQQTVDWPLTLDNLDTIFAKDSLQREVSSERVVEKAVQIIRPIAQKCIDCDGLDVVRFIELLARRASRAKQSNISLDSALGSVNKWMVEFREARAASVAAA